MLDIRAIPQIREEKNFGVSAAMREKVQPARIFLIKSSELDVITTRSTDAQPLRGWFVGGGCGEVVEHVLHLRHVVHHVLDEDQGNGIELGAFPFVPKDLLVTTAMKN